MPCEDRVKLLYPNDVGKRCNHRDLVTECELLKTFSSWAKRTTYDRGDPSDSEFLSALAYDIDVELKEVSAELDRSNSSNADKLTLWEYDNLDNDMKTSFIEAEYRFKADIFQGCSAAREKYIHVCKRTLAEWEAIFMTAGLTGRLKEATILPDLGTWRDSETTASVFDGCEEAKRKYPSLVDAEERRRKARAERAKPEAEESSEDEKTETKTLESWENEILRSEGPKALLQELLYLGDTIFNGCSPAKEKYGYLGSPTLSQWEETYLDKDGGQPGFENNC